MKQLMWTVTLAGLCAATAVSAMETDMRCRIDGAYIKTYGDNESEQRKNCEQQGGVLAKYVPHESQGDRGQRGGDSHPSMGKMMGGGSMSRY